MTCNSATRVFLNHDISQLICSSPSSQNPANKFYLKFVQLTPYLDMIHFNFIMPTLISTLNVATASYLGEALGFILSSLLCMFHGFLQSCQENDDKSSLKYATTLSVPIVLN